MTTLSPIRRVEHNCPRPLRSNTVNQMHATAQQILNKQLPDELKNELALETTRDAGSNPLKQRSLHHNRLHATVLPIANYISAASAETRAQKPVASSRQTKHTHRENVSSMSSASLKHGSSTNRTA